MGFFFLAKSYLLRETFSALSGAGENTTVWQGVSVRNRLRPVLKKEQKSVFINNIFVMNFPHTAIHLKLQRETIFCRSPWPKAEARRCLYWHNIPKSGGFHCRGSVTLHQEQKPGNNQPSEAHTDLFDSMDVGSCFLFVCQHTLCLQGVECYCAAPWTVAWWREEVQVVAKESGNLQQNRDIMSQSNRSMRPIYLKKTY